MNLSPGDVPLLHVQGLTVGFPTLGGTATALDGVSFTLVRSEVLGIVGETGAGKSVLARSIIGLLPGRGRIISGDVMFAGESLLAIPERQYRRLRGRKISLIGTNAKALLDPVTPIGCQIARIVRAHLDGSRQAARQKAVALLRSVGIAQPEQWAKAYPHELSGGMAQRAVIAMALAGEPELLLADEPTLGLDTTIQIQVLDLILQQAHARRCAVILITHDLGIIARYCHRIGVMQKGRLIELSAVDDFLRQPTLPYSKRLLAAARARLTPSGRAPMRRVLDRALLRVRQLRKIYPATGERGEVRAVDGVDFVIRSREILAVVGESGAGKTTLGQCLLRLLPATEGQVLFDGTEITRLTSRQFRPFRRQMQMVFQESYLALDPRWRVADLIGEPFALLPPMTRAERARRVARLLEMVQLPVSLASATPQQLTAGEQKRVGIARALATDPAFIVFDEPTTALDVTVHTQIIELIRDLQARVGLTALLITHDLNSVRSLAEQVMIMNRGKVVESGETGMVFSHPADAYTRTLLAAELAIPQPKRVGEARPARIRDLRPPAVELKRLETGNEKPDQAAS
jgi:peptide/nickel transport system ATP-binding protein